MIDIRADRRLLDYRPELELPAPEGEGAPWRDEYGEMDFAARLLEARSPAALTPVLSDIVRAADNGRGDALRGPVLGVLQRAARLVFPLNATRAPADLKRKAATVFGMELEGLSPEDKEFEVARRFVRLAGAAARQALARADQPQARAVRQALLRAARETAPGLLRATAAASSGTWRRRGNAIEIEE